MQKKLEKRQNQHRHNINKMSRNVTSHGELKEITLQQTVDHRDTAITSLLRGFQVSNSESFSSVSMKKSPFYRRKSSYTKSKTQYWKERKRRKRVWQLSGKGYTYPQIAKKLGVSAKTVQRDMKKVRRYYIGQLNKSWRMMQEERTAAFDKKLEGLNLGQRFKITTALLCDFMDRKREREYNRHLIKITVDMDNWIGDHILPRIVTWPKNNFKITLPLHLELAYKMKGEIIKCGGFTLG